MAKRSSKRKVQDDDDPPPPPPVQDDDDAADDGTHAALLEAVARKAHGPLMHADLRPLTAYTLATFVQLGLRHPHVTHGDRVIGQAFVTAVKTYFGDCPVVLEQLQRGDDPDFDV